MLSISLIVWIRFHRGSGGMSDPGRRAMQLDSEANKHPSVGGFSSVTRIWSVWTGHSWSYGSIGRGLSKMRLRFVLKTKPSSTSSFQSVHFALSLVVTPAQMRYVWYARKEIDSGAVITISRNTVPILGSAAITIPHVLIQVVQPCIASCISGGTICLSVPERMEWPR